MTKARNIKPERPKAPPSKEGEPTEIWCAKQTLRLMGVPKWFPQAREGQDEIEACLRKYCTSNKHVEVVVSWFLEKTEKCDNIVAELVRLAKSIGEHAQTVLPGRCDICANSIQPDFVEVYRENGSYRGVGRCSCARGRALYDRDRQRDEDIKRLDRQRTVV